MGRHSVGGSSSFRRSLLRAGARWGIAAAVLVVAAVLVWAFTRGDGETAAVPPPEPGLGASSPSPATSPPPAASPSPVSPTPAATPPGSPSPAPGSPASPTPEGIQVLDGAERAGSGNRAAAALREKGFEVVFVGNAIRRYRETTVFYQPGSEDLARRAASAMGSDAVRPAPDNLDREIPVTVVVGDDFST